VTLRQRGIAHASTYPRSATIAAQDIEPEIRVLERAYPIAKRLAELLELEAMEPIPAEAKRLRWAIGGRLEKLARLRRQLPPYRDDAGRG
jgi:hypothetical protein